MKKVYLFIFSFFIYSTFVLSQDLLQPFKDGAEWHPDFEYQDLIGWTSLDLDGFPSNAGPFQDFPGKGNSMGFIVYTPGETDPENTIDSYIPYEGQKYFASISSYDGPVNDWLISDELADHPGGVFSFYVKSAATYAGVDKFKVGYSTTGNDPEDFILFNDGNPTSSSAVWVKHEFNIPADAKHLAINCVSDAVMFLVDNIQFVANTLPETPAAINDFSINTQLGDEIFTTLSWTNPTLDTEGNDLTDFDGVKIYRGTHPMNLTEIADVTGSPGEAKSYQDILLESGFFIYRLVPYNTAGNGEPYVTPVNYFGYETIPGAAMNITFSQDENQHTIISWDEVDYGSMGGTLESPVVGYTIIRSNGSNSETLVTMLDATTYTETEIPSLYLYEYTILAHLSEDETGVPAVAAAYSGMDENQFSVTTGTESSDQPFELSRTSIISQSIYTPDELGEGGLITAISYFANIGTTSTAHYKIYMSMSDRETFGTTLDNAVWEFFGDQQLVFDGDIEFLSGRNDITITLDQPFFYDDSNGDNVIITIVKPLFEDAPWFSPMSFYNTSVDGMRTYAAVGYSVDLSIISTQPASWSTDEVPTIPSIVVEKITDYGNMTGTVTAFSDNAPLEGTTVTLAPADGSNAYQTITATTDADGNYEMEAILPGDYTVTFIKDSYNTFETSITVDANESLVLDAVLDNAIPIEISGVVQNSSGEPIEGVTLTLTGYSNTTAVTDASGSFVLDAFAEKAYNLEIFHPLYIPQEISLTSEEESFDLDPIVLEISAHKPVNVTAVNNDGVGEVSWDIPAGYYNETQIGWGSFIASGDAWGNGGDPFMAAIRFTTADLEDQVAEDAVLTHVKVYFNAYANVDINIFEGENAGTLIHTQPENVTEEGWYEFELLNSIPIDFSKELWIGVDFHAGQYGAYPIGLDDGPNVSEKKGSMKYENGSWAQMSLTNKNWNIYGLVNNFEEASPDGYKVYRSLALEENWTELTSTAITETSYQDETLAEAQPNMYKYGIEAIYGDNLVSEKGISNPVEHQMFIDFTVEVDVDYGSANGAYVSIWNDEDFAEGFLADDETFISFEHLMQGTYSLRVELENYEIVELTGVVAGEENNMTTVNLNMLKIKPSNLTASILENGDVQLNWSLHEEFTDKMERYEDFERENISNYILLDVDGLPTYTYTNFTWPNAGVPMSFMIMNPFATTPPVGDLDPFSGRRFLSAFAGPDGVNNDWLIIPAGQGEFSFMASSLVSSDLEKMRVLYSTSGSEISDFVPFEGVISVPAQWTEYSYEAPEGTNYVAINYVGDDTYIFKIDDITFQKEYNHALSYNIFVDNVMIATNIDETNYLLEDISSEYHLIEVEAVYPTGTSEKAQVEINTIGINDAATPEFGLFPNPATEKVSVKINSPATVRIADVQGRIIYSEKIPVGTTVLDCNMVSGTYMVIVETENGISTKKLIKL